MIILLVIFSASVDLTYCLSSETFGILAFFREFAYFFYYNAKLR